MNNLAKRILSAVILAPLVLWIIHIGGLAYYTMIGVACVIMYWEWVNMTKTSKHKWLWWFGGLFYIGVPCACLIVLGETGEFVKEPIFVYLILAVAWSTDIGAYAAGRIIGGKKLAPKISPNKTWAGLFGGMFCAGAALGSYGSILAPYEPYLIYVLIGAFLAVVSQAGDLFESWIKRKFNVKDSGNLIPGHGGLLDRLDGVLFLSVAVGIVLIIKNI